MPTTTEQQKIKITRLQERIDRLEEFQNEVLSLWNWGDEDVEAKTDPLEFVKEQVKELRKWDAIHGRRLEQLADYIEALEGICAIPHYAYGDNEAACAMVSKAREVLEKYK